MALLLAEDQKQLITISAAMAQLGRRLTEEFGLSPNDPAAALSTASPSGLKYQVCVCVCVCVHGFTLGPSNTRCVRAGGLKERKVLVITTHTYTHTHTHTHTHKGWAQAP